MNLRRQLRSHGLQRLHSANTLSHRQTKPSSHFAGTIYSKRPFTSTQFLTVTVPIHSRS